MGLLNTALTRLGVGGPSINYSRPITDKVALVVFVARFIEIPESADVTVKPDLGGSR